MSRMHNLVICYFVFKNQSHYSGFRGQRVKVFKCLSINLFCWFFFVCLIIFNVGVAMMANGLFVVWLVCDALM